MPPPYTGEINRWSAASPPAELLPGMGRRSSATIAADRARFLYSAPRLCRGPIKLWRSIETGGTGGGEKGSRKRKVRTRRQRGGAHRSHAASLAFRKRKEIEAVRIERGGGRAPRGNRRLLHTPLGVAGIRAFQAFTLKPPATAGGYSLLLLCCCIAGRAELRQKRIMAR